MGNSIAIQIRWTDIDANRHVKHSSYYDFGAIVRMNFFDEHGLTTEKMEEFKIGPILFREEAVFRREIRYEDRVTIDVELSRATPDYSRWTLRHHIYLNDKTVAAIITVDGAWIDLSKRKLTTPNEQIRAVCALFHKADNFSEIEV
jgi:acyl-CoA thioester hydrolase